MNWTKKEDGSLECWPFRITIDQYGAASLTIMGGMATRNKKDIKELQQLAEDFLSDILAKYGDGHAINSLFKRN